MCAHWIAGVHEYHIWYWLGLWTMLGSWQKIVKLCLVGKGNQNSLIFHRTHRETGSMSFIYRIISLPLSKVLIESENYQTPFWSAVLEFRSLQRCPSMKDVICNQYSYIQLQKCRIHLIFVLVASLVVTQYIYRGAKIRIFRNRSSFSVKYGLCIKK